MFTIQLDTDVIKFVVKLLIVRYFQDILGELAGYNVILIELNLSTQENVINGCFFISWPNMQWHHADFEWWKKISIFLTAKWLFHQLSNAIIIVIAVFVINNCSDKGFIWWTTALRTYYSWNVPSSYISVKSSASL